MVLCSDTPPVGKYDSTTVKLSCEQMGSLRPRPKPRMGYSQHMQALAAAEIKTVRLLMHYTINRQASRDHKNRHHLLRGYGMESRHVDHYCNIRTSLSLETSNYLQPQIAEASHPRLRTKSKPCPTKQTLLSLLSPQSKIEKPCRILTK